MINYIKLFYKDAFKYEGRTSRKDFWLTILYLFLLNIILWIAILIIGSIIFAVASEQIGQLIVFIMTIFYGIFSCISIVCSWSLFTRRLHDVNHSGDWIFCSILLLRLLWIVVLVFCCMDSVNENNKY